MSDAKRLKKMQMLKYIQQCFIYKYKDKSYRIM